MEPETVQQVASNIDSIKVVVTGLTIAIGVIFPALSIWKIGSKAVESIARNPEAAGKIQTAMILSVAFTEAIAIYVLVIALIIKFV